MMQLALADRLTTVTWIVEPAMPTVPQVEVVAPSAVAVVEGADQPAGTATVSSPFERLTPEAAVYVKVSVLPVDETIACTGETVIVPVPSFPTVTVGEEAI